MGVLSPPHVFPAVAGDLIQLLVLLGAAAIPVMILIATLDPSLNAAIDDASVERILTRLNRMMLRSLTVFGLLVLSVLAVIVAKFWCTWLSGPSWWESVADRVFLTLAGALVGGALVGAVHLLRLYGEAHRYRNFLFWAKSGLRGATRKDLPE